MNDSTYLAGAALSGTAQMFNTAVQFAQNKTDKKFTREMFDKQTQVNRENWQMANEYNTPLNQMKRFAEAGLNPNLIYGQGNVAQQPASSSTPSWHQQAPQIDPSALMTFFQLKNLDLQNKSLQEDIYNKSKDWQLKDQQLKNLAQDEIAKKIDNAFNDFITFGMASEHSSSFMGDYESPRYTKYSEELTILKLSRDYQAVRNGILEQYGPEEARLKNEQLDQTVKNLVQTMANLQAQYNLTSAQTLDVYKSIEVKNATIQEIMTRCDVNREQAEVLYNTAGRIAVGTDLDILKGLESGNLTQQLVKAAAFGNLDEGNQFTQTMRQAIEKRNAWNRARRYPTKKRKK